MARRPRLFIEKPFVGSIVSVALPLTMPLKDRLAGTRANASERGCGELATRTVLAQCLNDLLGGAIVFESESFHRSNNEQT